MSEITKKDVEQIAKLAQINLSEDEITLYQKDMDSVLGYFDSLAKIETDDVEEVGHITGMKNVYRIDAADAVTDEQRDRIMENVPKCDGDHIEVKNVL